MSEQPLSGTVALVTGGNQGIGQAIVLGLARQGAIVAFTTPDASVRPDETLAQLDALGAQHEAFVSDVSQARDVANVTATILARFGRLDLLVNNAGMYPRAYATELDEATWDRTLNTNLKGAWLSCRAAAPAMIRQGRGRIINITSVAGIRGAVRGAHYAASKAGLIALTKSLALELAPHGILVNAVAPGLTDTAQPRAGMSEEEIARKAAAIPLGRMATADDVARTVCYLAGPQSDYITGQTLHVNGGDYLV